MANPNPIPHPFLLNPGTRQADRQLIALNPESIKIDDRKLGELLVYLHDFATQVNFYDLNLGLHDWQQFFGSPKPKVKGPDAIMKDKRRIPISISGLVTSI